MMGNKKFSEDEILDIEHIILSRVIELGRIVRENRNNEISEWANAELLKLMEVWKRIKKKLQDAV